MNQAAIFRYRDIIAHPIPDLSGDVERAFSQHLKVFADNNNVEDPEVLNQGIMTIRANLSHIFRRNYSRNDVMYKIIQIRHKFVTFRRYIALPRVEYNEDTNVVMVHPQYFLNLPNGQEPERWANYRVHGLSNYKVLNRIFMFRRFPLLPEEPILTLWDAIPGRPGDFDPAHHGPNDEDD